MGKQRVLWIGDFGVPSGFARVTENILPHLQAEWDIAVLAINFYGDTPYPPRYPFALYPAASGGDVYGVGRYRALIDQLQPDVVCILHDPHVVARFLAQHALLPDWPQCQRPPVAAYLPVHGANVAHAAACNGLDLAIAYTAWGKDQLERGGFDGPIAVIPHGVDVTRYAPQDKAAAREQLGVFELNHPDAFVVGSVARNQFRKRLDLLLLGFRLFLEQAPHPERTFLWLHCAEQDVGWDVRQLASHLGMESHVLLPPEPLNTFTGIPEDVMPTIYSAFDCHVLTSLGEGWGLPVLEAMACGVPNLVPRWAGLADWPAGYVAYIDPGSMRQTVIPDDNTVGMAVDPVAVAQGLTTLVRDPDGRATLARDAWAFAQRPGFRWMTIAHQFSLALQCVRERRAYAAPAAVGATTCPQVAQ